MKPYSASIAEDLSAAFPEIGEVESVTILGEGFRSLVVGTPGGEVFKIARNWDGGAGYLKEFRLLPLIRDELPLPVPYPVWHAGPSSYFPFGVIGYPKLEGAPMSESGSGSAPQVARFLQSLHGIEIAAAVAESVPAPRAFWNQIERLYQMLAPSLREIFDPGEYTVINRWWRSFLADQRMHAYRPVLHHGDFWYGNLLVSEDGATVTGVLDWENAAIGDPAQDIATLLHCGRPFTQAVLEEYAAAGGILDTDLLYRAQRLWELREFSGIGFAIQTMDQREYDEAVEKLRRGPLLNEVTRKETALWPPQRG